MVSSRAQKHWPKTMKKIVKEERSPAMAAKVELVEAINANLLEELHIGYSSVGRGVHIRIQGGKYPGGAAALVFHLIHP